jgi:uncharacterized protein YkwD
MKFFYKTVVIIFILSALFIFRDNLASLYNDNFLSLKTIVSSVQKTKNNLILNFTDIKKNIDTVKKINSSNKEVKPITVDNVNISEPLRLINNIISTNNKDILSKENIILLTNQSRKENGSIALLKENFKLNFSAEKKLQDMFTKQYFEHISPSGVGVGNLGQQVGYEYIIIGENLALGNFKDDKALVDAWMASPGHRANILNSKYTDIGIAVSKGKYEGKDTWMAVQHFGLPKSVCPTIDEVLHGLINLDQEKVKTIGSELESLKANIDQNGILEGKTTVSSQIEKYNFNVSNYNDLISGIKKKINQYNDQVNAFNTCISKNS